MTHSFYKLQILNKVPEDFEGKVFSFSKSLGGEVINLDDDPFLSVKKAVSSAIGHPCALIREGSCFFSELFISLYEQLSFTYLEIKDFFKTQTKAFLEKKGHQFHHILFTDPSKIKTIVIGKSSTLLDDLDLIKNLQDKFLIVAAYSTLPILHEKGIVCDMAFAFDPKQQKHSCNNAKILAIAPKTAADILEGFEKVALFPESYCGFSNYLYWHTPHPPIYGYTIIDTCLKFLIQSGLKEFYLSGVSLEEMEGFYADDKSCGYKPDFKKAKEHIEQLKERHGGIHPLTQVPINEGSCDKSTMLFEPFEVEEKLKEFEDSFSKVLTIDMSTLGLYEMFLLEQSPFYQIVLEPLYNKWMILQCDEFLDKRKFFETVLKAYAKDYL
jgi:Protein of unknown function DUF115